VGEERFDPGDGPPWPAALELDDLLEQLRGRARLARRSQERLGALLDAVMAVSSDLELSDVLSRIVQAACRLVDARYGALGVLGPDGEHLSEFITYGLTDEEREVIGELPRGHGVLGLLIRDPRPRRMRNIGEHPDSAGFPDGHPSMNSFLGTPVRIRDHVFGNLYMSEKRGAVEFSLDDEAMLTALAAAAGVAIENARLYDQSRREREWSATVSELTQTLLEGREVEAALVFLTERARTLSQADMAAVCLYEDSALIVRAVDSVHAVKGLGDQLADERWQDLMSGREPLLLIPAPEESLVGPAVMAARELGGLEPGGPVAVVPIAVGGAEIGLLIVGWPSSASAEAQATASLVNLTTFAQQAGLALEAANAQRDRARSALLEDRDRIARDMHDHVIQRLFATGLSLQSAARHADNPVTRERVEVAVDELDAAIKDIRNSIFALHRVDFGSGIRGQLDEIVASATTTTGFTPEFVVEGLLIGLPEPVEVDLVAVVREGLSNIARHAHATSARVHVAVTKDLTVEISDNGVGADPGVVRSGLRNLERRATASGGTFKVSANHPSGLILHWSVPLG
jgi:signal transduction histidine kinase